MIPASSTFVLLMSIYSIFTIFGEDTNYMIPKLVTFIWFLKSNLTIFLTNLHFLISFNISLLISFSYRYVANTNSKSKLSGNVFDARIYFKLSSVRFGRPFKFNLIRFPNMLSSEITLTAASLIYVLLRLR